MPVSAIRFPQLLELAPNSELVLFVADFFHPIDRLAVQRFLNGDMRHRGRRGRTVPMLLVRRKPDHIAGANFLDRFAPTLRPSKTRRDDQRLTEWMCMPRSTGTRLERDACAPNTCGFGRFEQRVNAHPPGEPVRRPFT